MKIVFRYEYRDDKDNLDKLVEYTTHEIGLHELMQDYRAFLLAIGFSPEGVENYIEAD